MPCVRNSIWSPADRFMVEIKTRTSAPSIDRGRASRLEAVTETELDAARRDHLLGFANKR